MTSGIFPSSYWSTNSRMSHVSDLKNQSDWRSGRLVVRITTLQPTGRTINHDFRHFSIKLLEYEFPHVPCVRSEEPERLALRASCCAYNDPPADRPDH